MNAERPLNAGKRNGFEDIRTRHDGVEKGDSVAIDKKCPSFRLKKRRWFDA
jgi:hypothetical protein